MIALAISFSVGRIGGYDEVTALAPAGTPTHVTSTTLNGTPAWKLTQTQHQGTTTIGSTIYLDSSSLYWLRYVGSQRDSRQKNSSRIQIDFSRYGQKVTITPPRYGARW